MPNLDFQEEQWLALFAKDNEFFASLLNFCQKRGFLTYKQFRFLKLEIEKAEENGETVITEEDYQFLLEYSKVDDNLEEILEIYEDNGFLFDHDYNEFIDLKLKYINKDDSQPNQISIKIDKKKSINKVPCPHCSFLCLPEVKFCLKCGEPLLNLRIQTDLNKIENLQVKEFVSKSPDLDLKEPIDEYSEKFKQSQRKFQSLRKKYYNNMEKESRINKNLVYKKKLKKEAKKSQL